MPGSRWHAQDGFIREIVWLAVVIALIAVLVLDGFAIFTANQAAKDEAQRAARAAADEYAQSLDVPAARRAAQQALVLSDERLVHFESAQAADGGVTFTVTARAHADTLVFKYLRYVGLKKWVNEVTNPTETRSSS